MRPPIQLSWTEAETILHALQGNPSDEVRHQAFQVLIQSMRNSHYQALEETLLEEADQS